MPESHTSFPRVEELGLAEISEGLGHLRIASAAACQRMRSSLLRHGQISAVVVFERHGRVELIDGFKRLSAARTIEGFATMLARFLVVDEPKAKAAMLTLNRIGSTTRELEEARIIASLVKDDGLSQTEVAELIGRHKSFVCRRLTLIERLCDEATQDLSLGLLSPTAAREIGRLPHGNQKDVLEVAHRDQLSTAEVALVVRLLRACPDRARQEFVLKDPREALLRQKGSRMTPKDPRLSEVGNLIRVRLAHLLEGMPRLESWLRNRGHAELLPPEVEVLQPSFEALARRSRDLARAARAYLHEKNDR